MADRLPRKLGAAAKVVSTVWVALSAQVGMLRDQPALLRAGLAPLTLPPILCALASLFAQRVEIQWASVVLTLLASVLALMGVGALPSGQRLGDARAWVTVWRPQRAGAAASMTAQERYAARLGSVLLALAALFAAPVAFSGAGAAWLLVGMGMAVVALYASEAVRRRIAPLDEIIVALCLGPGMVALTVAAQGQRMSGQDWLIAIAFGCMALALIEGRRLRASDAKGLESHGRRTLVHLIGKRGAIRVAGLALLVGFAVVVLISGVRSGLPGALLALTAAPLSLSGLSGLAISYYPPARRTAATQLAQAYGWFGLALATGIALTVVAQSFTGAIVRALGG
jgi:1,4-dihydroxy-2-naphthoate octaprenyltransferase